MDDKEEVENIRPEMLSLNKIVNQMESLELLIHQRAIVQYLIGRYMPHGCCEDK